LVAATRPRCIFTDPPYGIALAEWDDFKLDTSLIRDTHRPDDNLLLLQKFITDSFPLCTEPAWMFLWCDFEVWPLLKEFGERAGWRVQRWPLVWVKPNHRSNQTPFSNFTKSTEAGILMAKGSATLTNPAPPNWVMLDNTKPSDITNPFYKPKEAHMAFLRHLAPIGSTVVDPFCGSGSIAEAAIALGVNYIGGDIDPVHIANARSRLKLT
jgi:site-specific DNA-methyltransferase (adenine-specific)